MQFLIGIQHMTRDEKILLLSQLNAITTRNVLNQGVQTMAKKAKNFTLKQSSTLARYVNAHTLEEKIEQLDQISEWDAEVLARKIEEEIEKNSFLKDRELNVHIKWKIAELAGADKNEEDTKIAAELVNRLAVLYDINPALYPTSTALEEEVYAACIEEQIKILKKKLQSMSAEEEKTLEEALREELGRLSRAEQEAIKELSGLEELSAQSILNLLKTTSSSTGTDSNRQYRFWSLPVLNHRNESLFSFIGSYVFIWCLYCSYSGVGIFAVGPVFVARFWCLRRFYLVQNLPQPG